MAKQPTPPIRSLSEADEETLTAMIAWWNNRQKKYEDSGPPRPMNASDVHLVELIDAIPARSGMTIQKGQARLLRPIMDEIADDPTDITLEYVEIDSVPYELTIWNTSGTALVADDMIHVKRLKYGLWVPDAGGEVGAPLLVFSIQTADCTDQTATALVTHVACGLASPAVGDTIDLIDPAGCYLTGREELLIGASGWATKVEGSYGCEWAIVAMCCGGFSC